MKQETEAINIWNWGANIYKTKFAWKFNPHHLCVKKKERQLTKRKEDKTNVDVSTLKKNDPSMSAAACWSHLQEHIRTYLCEKDPKSNHQWQSHIQLKVNWTKLVLWWIHNTKEKKSQTISRISCIKMPHIWSLINKFIHDF